MSRSGANARVACYVAAFFLAAFATAYLRSRATPIVRSEGGSAAPSEAVPRAVDFSALDRTHAIQLPDAGPDLEELRELLARALRDGDLSPVECDRVLALVCAALRATPPQDDAVLTLLRATMSEGALLGSELIATAIGRARTPSSLGGLMEAIDSVRGTTADERLLVERLVIPLLSSSTRREAGSMATYVRFSVAVSSSAVSEPAVRRWAFAHLIAWTNTPGWEGVLVPLTLGLSQGEIDSDEAHQLADAIERVQSDVWRGNLFEATHLTQSAALRRRVADYVTERRWNSTYELRMAVSAIVKSSDHETLARVADMLNAGDNDTASAVLEFLPHMSKPRTDASAVVGRVVRMVFDEQGMWGLRTRQLAARALVQFVIANGVDRDLVTRALEVLSGGTVEGPLLVELANVGAYVRAAELLAFERAITRSTGAVRVALARSFVEQNHDIDAVERQRVVAMMHATYPEIAVVLEDKRGATNVVGVVVDQRGARIAYVTVRLVDNRGQEWASVVADEQGQFVFVGVVRGEYTLSCAHRGATGSTAGVVPGPGLQTVRIRS